MSTIKWIIIYAGWKICCVLRFRSCMNSHSNDRPVWLKVVYFRAAVNFKDRPPITKNLLSMFLDHLPAKYLEAEMNHCFCNFHDLKKIKSAAISGSQDATPEVDVCWNEIKITFSGNSCELYFIENDLLIFVAKMEVFCILEIKPAFQFWTRVKCAHFVKSGNLQMSVDE